MTTIVGASVARPLPVRSVLFLLASVCLIALYLISWWTYAYTHLEHRYVQLDPGEAYEIDGTTVRVLSIVSSERLADEVVGTPRRAVAGATWVVAELEAQQSDGAAEFLCGFEVLGPGGRTWSTDILGAQRTLPTCVGSEIKPGPPRRFEVVVQVPLSDVDQLIGFTLPNPNSSARTPVLSPAR